MPSKLQHELNKLRGTTAADGKIYTSSIASLQDALTDTKLAIKCLEAKKLDNTTKINNAINKSNISLSLAKTSFKKDGGSLYGSLNMRGHDISGITKLTAITNDCIYFYHKNNDLAMHLDSSGNLWLYGHVQSDTIIEKTNNAGVTIESLKIEDSHLEAPVLDKANITTSTKTTPIEGDIRLDSVNHKLQFYNGSAWETITST